MIIDTKIGLKKGQRIFPHRYEFKSCDNHLLAKKTPLWIHDESELFKKYINSNLQSDCQYHTHLAYDLL